MLYLHVVFYRNGGDVFLIVVYVWFVATNALNEQELRLDLKKVQIVCIQYLCWRACSTSGTIFLIVSKLTV